MTLGPDVLIFVAAAVLSYVLLLGLLPFLAHHALSKPNARSSHTTPTPQGGGIAVVAATIIVAIAATVILHAADRRSAGSCDCFFGGCRTRCGRCG